MQGKALAAWRARSHQFSGLDKKSYLRSGENTSRGTAHFFQVNIVRGWPFEDAISGLNNKDVEMTQT